MPGKIKIGYPDADVPKPYSSREQSWYCVPKLGLGRGKEGVRNTRPEISFCT